MQECHKEVKQEDEHAEEHRRSTCCSRSTDFLRRITASFGGQGGSHCRTCALTAFRITRWKTSSVGFRLGNDSSKKKQCNWWCAACGGQHRIGSWFCRTARDRSEAKVFRAHAPPHGACENLVCGLRLLGDQQLGGGSPVQVLVEGVQEQGRSRMKGELRRFTTVDNHEAVTHGDLEWPMVGCAPSSMPRMWEIVGVGHRWWTRTGTPSAKTPSKASEVSSGKGCSHLDGRTEGSGLRQGSGHGEARAVSLSGVERSQKPDLRGLGEMGTNAFGAGPVNVEHARIPISCKPSFFCEARVCVFYFGQTDVHMSLLDFWCVCAEMGLWCVCGCGICLSVCRFAWGFCVWRLCVCGFCVWCVCVQGCVSAMGLCCARLVMKSFPDPHFENKPLQTLKSTRPLYTHPRHQRTHTPITNSTHPHTPKTKSTHTKHEIHTHTYTKHKIHRHTYNKHNIHTKSTDTNTKSTHTHQTQTSTHANIHPNTELKIHTHAEQIIHTATLCKHCAEPTHI